MPTHTTNASPSQLLHGDDSAVNIASTSPFSTGVGLPRKLERGTCNLTPAPIPKLTEKMAKGACVLRQRMLSGKGRMRTEEMQKDTPLGEEEEVRKMNGEKESTHR